MRFCLRLVEYHAVAGNLDKVNAVAGVSILELEGSVIGYRFQAKP